jgi:hypothetical protein
LWLHVIESAGDDEPVGDEATGQELLCEPVGNDKDSRTLVDSSPSPTVVEQVTLDGERVETVNDDGEEFGEVKQNWAKKKNGEGEGDVDPGQLRLPLFEEPQTRLDEWADTFGATDTVSV